MAEISLSATEAALENQRLGALQIRRAALCTLVQVCDGYDIGSIGIAELLVRRGYDREYVDALLADQHIGDRTIDTVRRMLRVD